MRELTLGDRDMVLIAMAAALAGGLVHGFASMSGLAIILPVLTQFCAPASVLGKGTCHESRGRVPCRTDLLIG